MDRIEKAELICKRMQKDLDKLKKLNFSMSQRYESISIFDNEIKPEQIGTDYFGHEEDFGNQVVFSFDCAHYKTTKK